MDQTRAKSPTVQRAVAEFSYQLYCMEYFDLLCLRICLAVTSWYRVERLLIDPWSLVFIK